MFLWSPDAEAVLVAMSCFRHLCEEADIRSAADEVPVQTILPNYSTFSELASVSNMMGTGKCHIKFIHPCFLFFDRQSVVNAKLCRLGVLLYYLAGNID